MEVQTSSTSASLWSGVWIAIPAYNEERTIRELSQAALALCPRVMVIDDGSTDATAGQVRDLPITLLQHPVNLGKGASLMSAFRHALANDAVCVITLDGDGQHEPRDLPRLLSAWREHEDRVVIGSRLHDRSQFPRSRYRANRIACFWISWAAGHPIADSQSGLRVYPSAVMQIAVSGLVQGGRFTFESEVLIEAADHGHLTLARAVPGRYPMNARPSHFRPVSDIAKIVVMVGFRLLKKGMSPRGLWRSLQPSPVSSSESDAQLDARTY